MHVCVFCMKHETRDFLANLLICLKQSRHNGNCPRIFPLKVTKRKDRGGGTGDDRKTHARSTVTDMPGSHTEPHQFAGRSVIFSLAFALPLMCSGIRVYEWEGHGHACAGARSEHEQTPACPYLFCRLPLRGYEESTLPCHCPMRVGDCMEPAVTLDGGL